MKVEIRHRWRVQSPNGRWFNTRHAASEETIRKQHPLAVAIEGSRTEQIILDQPAKLLQATQEGEMWRVTVKHSGEVLYEGPGPVGLVESPAPF